MKNSKSILFAAAIFSLCLTACQKEDLAKETRAITTEHDARASFDNTAVGLARQTSTPLSVSIKKESDCIRKGSNLRAYRVTINNTTIALNLNKYAIEWFNEDYDLLSETDELQCASNENYLVIVWDIKTGETHAQRIKIGTGNDQDVEAH